MRQIHWQIPFVSLDGISYSANIYQDEYTGEVVVLKGGVQPFVTQEDDDEDAFAPIRTSSGYLSVIVENLSIIDEILPNDTHDRYVELIDNTLHKCVWCGFLSPEQYSGEWDRPPFEMNLPLLSPIAAAANVDYEPIGGYVSVADILKHIFNDYIGVNAKFAFAYTLLDYVSRAFLNDWVFSYKSEGESVPAVGTFPLPKLKEDRAKVGDVLETICRLYGWTIHETPERCFFEASDFTTKYAFSDDLVTYEYVTINDVDLPQIGSADNSKSILPGRSAVQVVCDLESYSDLLDGNLSGCSSSAAKILFDEEIKEYLRWNDGIHEARQYSASTGQMVGDTIDILQRFDETGRREYLGGQWYTLAYAVEKPTNKDYQTFKDCLIITNILNRPAQNIAAGILRTKENYSGVNFSDYGLCLTFDALATNDKVDFKYNPSSYMYLQIKWGDKYYNHTGWVDNPTVLPILVDNDEEEGEVAGRPYNLNADGTIWGGGYDKRGFWISVPATQARTLNGRIEITLYVYRVPEISVIFPYIAWDAIKIENIRLEASQRNSGDLSEDKDDFRSDYRKILSQYRLEEYSYEQPMTNALQGHSPSGVSPLPAIGSDGVVEKQILDRLARWYDRNIEQLTVTVTSTNIPEGARVRRGSETYIVIAKYINWRDSQTTLTLQKLYEQN